MLLSEELKINLICYWRFARGCPIVAIEHNWRHSDVLAVTKDGMLIETEVKTTLQDLKRDNQKPKHYPMGRQLAFDEGKESDTPYRPGAGIQVNYFYFAVPAELADKALEVVKQSYSYAGLLAVHPTNYEHWDNYHDVVHKAHRFAKPELPMGSGFWSWGHELMDLVAGQSTTVCRMAFELLAANRNKEVSNE